MKKLAIVLIMACAMTACSNAPSSTDPNGAATDGSGVLEGKLVSGVMGIGGESTGWAIEQRQRNGKMIRNEIDVARVATQAAEMEGITVRVLGKWEDRHYVERGSTPVFVVEKLEGIR